MNLLSEYRNGNYSVKIFDEGTKIRETYDNNAVEFVPDFPECFDLKITDKCTGTMCAFCHENSGPTGLHGDILNAEFINTLLPYTELAIGGGNPLEHPDLIKFLKVLKSKNIIANLTVHQKHFAENYELLMGLSKKKLIYGLGVSLVNPTDEIIELFEGYPNLVIHVINGIVTQNTLEKLYNRNLKILILGYKMFRRGQEFYNQEVEDRKNMLYNLLPTMRNKFLVISFDNLAIKQLNVRRMLSNFDWDQFYMGDDGKYTMYIDMVKNQFSKSSTSVKRHSITDDIVDMFRIVRNEE
jgi:hypothetical protein